jgi:hypothetical protein
MAAAVAAALSLAACGAAPTSDRQVASLSTSDGASDGTAAPDGTDGTAPATTAPSDPNEAALQFAKCMREHGVDMPDPVVQDNGAGGGGVMIQVGGPGEATPDKHTLDEANQDCQHYLADAAKNFDPPSPEELEKMKEQALKFAQCMREHGVDMPDPVFSDDGSVTVGLGVDGPNGAEPQLNGPPIDPQSKEFQDANDACGAGNGGFGISVNAAGTVPG